MIGCASISVLGVVLGLIVGFDFDRIRDTMGTWMSEVRQTFAVVESNFDQTRKDAGGWASEMSLRNSVAKEFGTSQVNVGTSIGSGGTRLVIEMVDPPFAEAEVECQAKPRDVARFAVRHYAATDGLDGVTVMLTTPSQARSCEFSLAELSPLEHAPG